MYKHGLRIITIIYFTVVVTCAYCREFFIKLYSHERKLKRENIFFF